MDQLWSSCNIRRTIITENHLGETNNVVAILQFCHLLDLNFSSDSSVGVSLCQKIWVENNFITYLITCHFCLQVKQKKNFESKSANIDKLMKYEQNTRLHRLPIYLFLKGLKPRIPCSISDFSEEKDEFHDIIHKSVVLQTWTYKKKKWKNLNMDLKQTFVSYAYTLKHSHLVSLSP